MCSKSYCYLVYLAIGCIITNTITISFDVVLYITEKIDIKWIVISSFLYLIGIISGIIAYKLFIYHSYNKFIYPRFHLYVVELAMVSIMTLVLRIVLYEQIGGKYLYIYTISNILSILLTIFMTLYVYYKFEKTNDYVYIQYYSEC